MTCTAWKVSKYGVISRPYFPVLGLNTGKYGPEITLYLDILHAVMVSIHLTMMKNVNIFTIYESLLKNAVKNLPIIYQKKTNVPGKIASSGLKK